MLTDKDIAEAKRALKELSDEAQGNGNSEGWIAAQERPILAVIAAHEAKAAPAVPDADELESALERLVERCNTDQFLCNDDAVIHAEATLERIYKSRKSTATPAAPSQPVTDEEKQALVYEKLYACLHCGAPSQEPDDCRKRPRCGLADPCAWTTKREPSQTVTLTDGLIEKGAMTGMVDAQIDSIIAALREKQAKATP